MKRHSFSVLLSLALASSALYIPFSGSRSALQRRSGGSFSKSKVLAASDSYDGVGLSTVEDIIYLTNITVGGQSYPVQLDTGSSDLWVIPTGSSIPGSNITDTAYNLTYGIGWAFGQIAYAAVDFAGVSIPSQAFLNVSSANNPALSYNAVGVLGLGFTSLSTIDALVNETGASTGRSVLYNVFLDDPEQLNYIAFSLQRTDDSADQVQGSFSIGEVESGYEAILNSTAIPTWPPVSPNRWNILLDSFIVSSKTIQVSTNVTGAPDNKAVVSLDSGTSYTYCPEDVATAIYGGVSGANYDAALGQWVVPCDAEIDLALQFANQIYPVHPLDVVPQSLGDPSTCVGSFIPQSVSVGAGQFDWLVGDNVLRSIYSVYDFGDFDSSGNMGPPYVKLLSLVDPDEASVDFHNQRGGSPNTNITYNASNSTTGAPTSSASSSSDDVTVSDSTADSLNKIVGYIPAMLALLGLNAVVLLVVAAVGVWYMLRRKEKTHKSKKKDKSARLTAMPLESTHSSSRAPSLRAPSIMEPPQENHVYEPVSVTIPEDMPFEPPAPAFHAYDGDKRRPKSMLSTTSWGQPVPHDYRFSAASEVTAVGIGPSSPVKDYDNNKLLSPNFGRESLSPGERPKSVA